MKFIGIKVIFLGMLLSSIAFGASEQFMDNPIFGFSYNYEKFKYQSVDESILNKLKIKSDKYWIFAEYNVSDKEKYIVIAGMKGIIIDSIPQKVGVLEPTFGKVVLIKDGIPRVLGPSENLFFGDIQLSEVVVDQLSSDAVKKVIAVHGIDFAKNNFEKIKAELPEPLKRAIEVVN